MTSKKNNLLWPGLDLDLSPVTNRHGVHHTVIEDGHIKSATRQNSDSMSLDHESRVSQIWARTWTSFYLSYHRVSSYSGLLWVWWVLYTFYSLLIVSSKKCIEWAMALMLSRPDCPAADAGHRLQLTRPLSCWYKVLALLESLLAQQYKYWQQWHMNMKTPTWDIHVLSRTNRLCH
jgi:hypothetical protein